MLPEPAKMSKDQSKVDVYLKVCDPEALLCKDVVLTERPVRSMVTPVSVPKLELNWLKIPVALPLFSSVVVGPKLNEVVTVAALASEESTNPPTTKAEARIFFSCC